MSDIIQSSKCNSTTTDTPTDFLGIPSELRNKIYELLLVDEEPIDPWDYYDWEHKLTPAVLRVNKAIHREASSLFYAQNRFDFSNNTPEKVASFLEQIGGSNAAYIRQICIEFPKFCYLGLDDVTLEDDNIAILASIQSGCVNLSILTTSRLSTDIAEDELDKLFNPEYVTEALKQVDTHFRAIPSLNEIIVEVYQDGRSRGEHITMGMTNLGWTISSAERMEEEEDWGGSFSDYDDDDQGYGDDYDEYDDIDIDNDSDFWRRAAD